MGVLRLHDEVFMQAPWHGPYAAAIPKDVDFCEPATPSNFVVSAPQRPRPFRMRIRPAATGFAETQQGAASLRGPAKARGHDERFHQGPKTPLPTSFIEGTSSESCPSCACLGCQSAMGASVSSAPLECPNVPHHSSSEAAASAMAKLLWYSRLTFLFFGGLSIGGYAAFFIRGSAARRKGGVDLMVDDDGVQKLFEEESDEEGSSSSSSSSSDGGQGLGGFLTDLFAAPMALGAALIENITGLKILPERGLTHKLHFSAEDKEVLERTDLTDMEKAFLIMKGDYGEQVELDEEEKAILKNRDLTDMEKAFQLTAKIEDVALPGFATDMQKALRQTEVALGLRKDPRGGFFGALFGRSDDDKKKRMEGKTEMEQAYLGLLDDMHLDEDEMIPDMVKAFKYVAKKEGFKASAFDDTPPDSPKEDGKDGDEFAGEKNEAGFLDALLGRDGKTDMERAFSEVSAKVEKKKRKKAGGLLGGLFG